MKIFGDYHTHTSNSDGRATVLEMVRAGKERGLEEMAITDHGFSKLIKGLKRRHFDKIIGEIESARGEMKVLLGIESNIISVNGSIDVDQEIQSKLDLLLCGVHVAVFFSFRGFFRFLLPNLFFGVIRWTPRFQINFNTKVVKKAIEKNKIDILTHPSRYFKVDVEEIASACVARGTLIELNSKRISFRPIDFERMAKAGAKFIINSDAHSPKRVGDTARVEEFLKHCDYDPAIIINLNKTFTQYKKEHAQNDVSGTNQEGNTLPKKRGFFRRWF